MQSTSAYLKPCPHCGKDMPKTRGVCPECGGMTTWFKVRIALGCLAVSFFGLALLAMLMLAVWA